MNDEQRREDLIRRLDELDGLDASRYERLIAELSLSIPNGRDADGRLKLALFDARDYDLESFDQANGGQVALTPLHVALSMETVGAAEGFSAICIFVNDQCDAAIVERLAGYGVQLIALRCAGYNNVDLEACQQHGISVVRVPAYSPHAVAEHTVALMLMLNRHLHQAYLRNQSGYFVIDGLTGFDMNGKTVGVIGTGKIGQCLIEILLGFGCHVLAYDLNPLAELAARSHVTYVDLPQLLSTSDIISLHLPLFDATHHLIDEAAIEQMKTGVMLINTSRGGLVDAAALVRGLKSGKIGSAGLDVYEEEAGIFFHDMSDKVLTDDVLARLMTFGNVVVTSHQAFLTREALANIAETTLASVHEFDQGKRGAELSYYVR